MTIESRLKRIEGQFDVSEDGEIVEIPLDHGQILRSTHRELNRFLEWLKDRKNNGQETIETA